MSPWREFPFHKAGDPSCPRNRLHHRRARGENRPADKSLELNKFYVNALYVAMTRAMEGLALVESDVRHPLLGLLELEEVAEIATGPVQASTRDEWAQEARKLELQGKQEQARSIRETFLASRPTPWTPWSLTALREWAPKALDPRNPSAKIKQNMFDYALWHGQGAYIEKLAREAKFGAALPLTHEGDLLGRSERTLYGLVELDGLLESAETQRLLGRRSGHAGHGRGGKLARVRSGHAASFCPRLRRCRPIDASRPPLIPTRDRAQDPRASASPRLWVATIC